MTWKASGYYVLAIFVLYLMLAYVAGFPVQQSFVLAFLLASVALVVSQTAGKPAIRFRPYYVEVQMKWYELLMDFHFVNKPEEWNDIRSQWRRKADQRFEADRVVLRLATISYREFDLYWEPAEWSDTFMFKTAQQLRDRSDEQRKALGWKVVEHKYASELEIHLPEHIEHKYFTVFHKAI